MRRFSVRIPIVAVFAMVGATLLAFAEPASAAPVDVSGCRATMASPKSNGSILGHYPSNPGTQSSYFASCQINTKAGDVDSEPNSGATAFTFHDFSNAVWHNGSVRQILLNEPGGNPVGTGPFDVDDCRGINTGAKPQDYDNSVISGTGVPLRLHIASMTGCTAASDTGTITVNKSVAAAAIADNAVLSLENSKARSVTNASYTSGGTVLTSSQGTFESDDVGCSISGTDIPGGATIASITATTATLAAPATFSATNAGTATVTICGTEETSTTRITNSANFASSTSVTDSGAVGNRFATTDVGLEIFDADSTPGTAVTEPCVITAFVSATSVTVANRDTGAGCVDGSAPATERTIVIGEPSPTAPADGDQLLHLGVQLDLGSLIPGLDDCSNDTAEGFAIAGTFRNPRPDNFFVGAFAAQPADTKAVGQILFDTSVVDFGAYVVERRASEPADPVITAPHYDYVVPNSPTSLAMCSSATAPGVGLTMIVDASTSSITSLPTGTGRPGTGQVRHLRQAWDGPGDPDGYSTTTHATSETPGVTWSDGAGPEVDFTRICVLPDPSPDHYEVGFQCGP
jgi:hypothetical protein